jgi:OOP family OmpA-OmpF porin
MKSAAILAAGIVALALLAALCLPRHLPPPSTASGPVIPANFHARVEHGVLILRGSLPSETSRAAVLQRAQELYGTTPGDVIDELAVDPRLGPVVWADNVSQVLPVLGHMTERGAIIIDGRTIVVSGQVGGDRAKTAVLEAIAPLTQTGLELEDRILTSPSSASPSPKILPPGVPSKKAPPLVVAMAPKTPSSASPTRKTPSPVVAPATKAPSLPAAPPLTETSPASLQKKLNEILARSSIEFESKSSTITPASLATLDQLVAEIRQSPHTAIEIGGHTDKYGEPEYNLQLSQRRADAVRRYFAKHGLTNQFTAVGYGASRPLSVSEKRSSLQRNRRIELRLKGQSEL